MKYTDWGRLDSLGLRREGVCASGTEVVNVDRLTELVFRVLAFAWIRKRVGLLYFIVSAAFTSSLWFRPANNVPV